MKQIKWRWDFGVYMPFCPHCDEVAWAENRCTFCGKPYRWVEGKVKPKIVTHGEFTAVQGTGNDIILYDGEGEFIMHASCEKKLTDEELIEVVKNFLNWREKKNEGKTAEGMEQLNAGGEA